MIIQIGDAEIVETTLVGRTDGKFKRTVLDNDVIVIVGYNADGTFKNISASHRFRIDNERDCIVFDPALKNEKFIDIQ